MIVNDLFGTLEMALLIRIILRFFAANPATPFVHLVYSVTDFLLGPVNYIFPNQPVIGAGVFDVVAIAGMIVYAIIFFLILKFFGIFARGPRTYV